mmetsp:Transcript_34736/g.34386  ORF Transcript_34736/g.34386 Transcript_34736/m.34386 type:complete len:175 (+) Transcript_34736:1008-1532(+)
MSRIKQILMNLISNAYKFTFSGSITIDISKAGGNFFEPTRKLIIKVIDTGVGIKEKDQQNLFKMFGMVRKHRVQFNTKGSGLGLTICQKLVTQMGGDIELKSEYKAGTEVTFSIMEENIPRRAKIREEIKQERSSFRNSSVENRSIDTNGGLIESSLMGNAVNIPNFRSCKFIL